MTYLLNRTLDDVRKSRDTDDKQLGKLPANQSETWKHDLFEDSEKKTRGNPPPRTTDPDTGHDDVDQGRSTSLLITNLHYDVSEAELEALFSQIGKIDRGPFIKFDQSGRASEGLAFVSYANESHAEAAMEAFNGASAKGQPIGVSYAFAMPGWVRGALGMRRDSATALPTFGLLGRIQQDRSSGRHSPYDSSRPRGPRSSFPPGKPHRSSNERGDYRRSTESFGSGVRTRGGPGYRGVVRPRGMGERTQHNPRSGPVKSARDLDKELEAFMGSTHSATGRGAENHPNVEADVQMAE